MKDKSTSYFTLAQMFITLAGFLFVTSTFLWGLEKEFAIQGVEEKMQNFLAEKDNQSQIKITWVECMFGFCTTLSDWFDQSYNYNFWKHITFYLGITFSMASILFWLLGHEELLT